MTTAMARMMVAALIEQTCFIGLPLMKRLSDIPSCNTIHRIKKDFRWYKPGYSDKNNVCFVFSTVKPILYSYRRIFRQGQSKAFLLKFCAQIPKECL
ncbi:hypothetical protein Q7A_03155 [Methylophaga nitratireducenticrescens]|nr:hypothetical protein Q7A_03155 [Methylophaga nitratireducenticrescens]AUZ83276.1 hypothetical protein CDW43_01180 [Methylophaga nitratireducenticrescens]